MASDTGKLSFARVAASSTNGQAMNNTTVQCPSVANGSKDRKTVEKATATTQASSPPHNSDAVEHKVTKGLKALDIQPRASEKTTKSGAAASMETPAQTTASVGGSNGHTPPSSEEVSQKADSSSELGTKPPSLDGKSITSGTTFNALDEKESLRPDDSASVKAAADEDDAFSIRGSLLINSRLGSDVAARVNRIQIGDMPPRLIPMASQEPVVSGVITPHSSSSEQQPVTEARVQLATSTSTPGGLNGQNPDEKLLEAMQTPKDRLFLLRLENDVVSFVQNSKEPFMDLPPSNSFWRMLTHKLADYYHMTHSFEAVAGSVRIYRTPFCRVPPPLASLVAASTPNSGTQPPIVQPRKIMRRGEDGELPMSAGPSKPTSEAGSDSKDKAPPAKEKLSREAREEAYNKARERIFGSTVPTEASTPENEDDTGLSRASSVSAKDRASVNKKGKTGKQRRDDSESFDSRSQYTPYYNHPQQPTWIPPQYVPVANPQFNGAAPMQQMQQMHLHPQSHSPQAVQQQMHQQQPPQQIPHFANAIQPQIAYGASTPAFQGVPHSSGHLPPASSMPHQGAPPQPVPPRHPAQSAPPAFPYASAGQPNVTQQRWQQQPQVPPFNSNVGYPPTQARSVPPQVGIPYAYGQLPVNSNPHDPKSQHPIPGSYAGNYNRHAFNPKTQSFIPGNGAMHMALSGHPIPVVPYGGNGGSSPLVSGPHQLGGQSPHQSPAVYGSGAGYQQQPGLSTSPYSGSTNSSYGMIRHGSENTAAAYLPTQPHHHQPPIATAYHQQGMPPYNGMSHGSPHAGSASHAPAVHGGSQTYDPNNQVPPLPHAPPHAGAAHGPHHGPPHGAPRGPSHHNKILSSHGPKQSNSGQSTNQAYGNLPNYGNPATLPQKPTSST